MKYTNITAVTKNGRPYFRARLVLPYDEVLGFQPSPHDFYGRTKAEAHAKRAKWKPETRTMTKELSLGDFVAQTYLPAEQLRAESGRISWSYFEARKRRIIKTLLDPTNAELKKNPLRSVRLGVLRPQQIDEWFAALHRSKIRQEDIHRCGDDARAILRAARHSLPLRVEAYFDGVDIPALPRRVKPRQLFDTQLIGEVLSDESKPLADRALVAFEFQMNCRPSEMFALRWEDIDWQSGRVNLWKRTVRTKDGWVAVDGSKTGASGVRSWGMGEWLTNLMRRYMVASNAKPTDHIFLTRRGLPLNSERFKDLWPQVKKSLSLPDGPTFYSLKHAGNSYALANGVSSQAQAAKMGHTTDRMAREVYREIMDTEKASTVNVYRSLITGQKAEES